MSLIYKLLERGDWVTASALGTYDGSSVDLNDGYIHFSTAEQVQETARRHFHGVADLVLLEVDAEALGAPVTWEPSRGGDMFPHLYGPMPVSAVIRVQMVELAEDGSPMIGALGS